MESLFEKMSNAHFDITGKELLSIVDALYESAKAAKEAGYTETARRRTEIADSLFKEYTWLLRAFRKETK